MYGYHKERGNDQGSSNRKGRDSFYRLFSVCSFPLGRLSLSLPLPTWKHSTKSGQESADEAGVYTGGADTQTEVQPRAIFEEKRRRQSKMHKKKISISTIAWFSLHARESFFFLSWAVEEDVPLRRNEERGVSSNCATSQAHQSRLCCRESRRKTDESTGREWQAEGPLE